MEDVYKKNVYFSTKNNFEIHSRIPVSDISYTLTKYFNWYNCFYVRIKYIEQLDITTSFLSSNAEKTEIATEIPTRAILPAKHQRDSK